MFVMKDVQLSGNSVTRTEAMSKCVTCMLKQDLMRCEFISIHLDKSTSVCVTWLSYVRAVLTLAEGEGIRFGSVC